MYLGVPVHSFVNNEPAKKELTERNSKVGSGFTLETSHLQFPEIANIETFDFKVIGFED